MGPTTVPSADTVKTAAKEFLKFINRSPSPFHVNPGIDFKEKSLVKDIKFSNPSTYLVLQKTTNLICGVYYREGVRINVFQTGKVEDLWKSARRVLWRRGSVRSRSRNHGTSNPRISVLLRGTSRPLWHLQSVRYRPGNGFNIIGAHTDSPVLKVKPISAREKHGYVQVGVECYGGGMWHSWLDRDLKLAGRVFIRTGDTIESRLLNVNRPIMRVPNICIHFQREMSTKFEFNKETHLLPVIATTVKQKLESKESTVHSEASSSQPAQDQCDKHSPAVIQLLCDELAVEPTQILDFELFLSDAVPATLGGVYEEFVFAPRLDNQHSCFCAIQGLTGACSEAGSLDNEPHIRMIALFDNEEVGSETAVGAGSTLLELILRRLSSGGSHTAFEESMSKSLMVSADMAHAIHPNYSEKHEGKHRPEFHKGVVIKINANQRYATTAATMVVIREVARKAGVPLQDFVVKNDSPCGSTIGPIMSAKLGIPTIDLGAAQLSMHSIREMCETTSVYHTTALFKALFEEYPSVMASIQM